MPSFRKLPIERKLTIFIMGTTCAALVLACAAFLIYDRVKFKQSLREKLATLADVVAVNSTAALSFDDQDDAAQTLRALSAIPSIDSACLYSVDGTLFAEYTINDRKIQFPESPGVDGVHSQDSHLLLFRPVLLNKRRIGTIYLRSSMEEMADRIRSYALISGAVMAGSLAAALALAFSLQRVISKPIVDLAETAKRVSEQQDFSVRVAKQSEDELGRLADAFNEMLAGIQQRDATLVGTNMTLRLQVDARMAAEHDLKILNDELEKRVKERTLDLQRSNKELEQFAYVASHDLQEPLRMIVSYLQLLDQRYTERLDDDGRQFLAFAVDGGSRMQTLIKDLLAFSRVGTRTKPFQPVDVGQLLALVLTNLKVAVAESGATITHDDMPTISGDSTQLAQVFQNLINNGIKFRGKDPVRIHISALRGDYEWRFGVRDNGIGIEQKYFERIFILFQRLHGREEYPGTGIGLAVCKKIVERHGGRIWVESQLGQGCTFYFTIADAVAEGI